MRIIAGERRGWKIEPPKGADVTRPITDRVKENLFNIIQMLVPEATVLDLFAGTGSLGLECLSRGAQWVTFVEQNLDTAAALTRNIARMKYEERCRLVRTNVLRLRPGIRDSANFEFGDELVFDLVFLDPPYKMVEDKLTLAHLGDAMAGLIEMGAIDDEAMIVLRYPSHMTMTYPWGGLALRRSRRYGSMTLDFLRVAAPSGADADETVDTEAGQGTEARTDESSDAEREETDDQEDGAP